MKIRNDYIVTSFDDEGIGLYAAVRVARLFVEMGAKKERKEIPIAEIQKEVLALNNKLMDFKNIHLKLTQIDNASSYIRKNTERLKNDIEMGLNSIKELLNGS